MKTHAQAKKAKHSSFEAKAKNQAPESNILQAFKNGTAQLASAEEEEPAQRQENKTGLPDNLKSGVENLSGQSLDDVKVHYNSSQPASLQAHAYAQGTDIHVAPGQEKHLPHEAWHVVQQKQGRVQPTKQLKGTTNINDDQGLEKEADVMGAKAMQLKEDTNNPNLQKTNSPGNANNAIQLATLINHTTGDYSYWNHTNGAQENQVVGSNMEAFLDPDDDIQGSATGGPQKDFIGHIRRTFPNDNMIRGHLLNHDLGGFGVEQNLFPITSAANGVHLRTVEYGVKAALREVDNEDEGRGVYYSVDVTGDYDDTKDAPVSTFECTASYIEDLDTHELGEKILDVHVISSPKKTGGKRAANLRGSAHDGEDGAVGNFPHSPGAASWKHGGRAGKLNFKDLVDQGKITTAHESVDEEEPITIDSSQLFLDEYGEQINEIIDQLIIDKQKDFDDLTQDDYDSLQGDDLALFTKYGLIITFLESQGINPFED